ncbi:molecular chaperone DnaJ [Marinobacter salinus]|uniref:Molecular chaperone DnaJ n=1 Tax=Marinobacter salinus TaxID=1874317 RepID=A0A1D9GIQ4_9GAMM|nr:DNA-J related domain-containing protein [Marinobacter salinus]AOY87375.1 molecular chaperone DnaJ [Marinobacter salinus]
MTNFTSGLQTPQAQQQDDDAMLEQQVQHLLVAVEHELRRAPAGINELGLIKLLQRPPWELIGEVRFNEPENLYPIHFLLFHVLYRLRDQLVETGETLAISPLSIRLSFADAVGGLGMPDSVDSLRQFYLDLSQYRLPEEAIQRMMNDFWAGGPGGTPERSEALNAAERLGFSGMPESFPEVKHRFRRAVMQAHPDRGGDTETIQGLNHAFSVLKAHFRLVG